MSVLEVQRAPNDDRPGLTESEAAARLRECGPNVLVPERNVNSPLAWLVRIGGDPMVLLLAVAGATYLLLGDRFDAAVTLGALLPIFLVNGLLEYRSENALQKLRKLAAPVVAVRRERWERMIPAREIVPGDVVLLREGDIVAADGEIVEGMHLLFNESALTGESIPVERWCEGAADVRKVLAGTTLISGYGAMAVTETGSRTQYGRIGKLMSEMHLTRTPIERKIHRLVAQLGVLVFVVCAVVVLVERYHGSSWPIALIGGVSLAMAAFPEEVPMVYTLYLALGAWRLAKDNALVRRLASVETLGAIDVICVDKTGTLTTGELSVTDVVAATGHLEPDLLRAAALASDARTADPIDGEILHFAGRDGRIEGLHQALVQVYPFDPARRYVSYVRRDGAALTVYAKGALEALLARSVTMPAAEVAALQSANERLASEGKRVIAVASKSLTAVAGDRAENERDLCIYGLIAFGDSVRPDVPGALARCKGAGIKVVMVTGDQPLTARYVASSLGIEAEDRNVLTGTELEGLDDDALASVIDDVRIFARTRPDQKLRIIRALHAKRHVVAMTGDGTNDALALREADIGIAMGRRGTEVAKSAADLVLLDDNFATIVRAVEDGRRIFDNLRHSFRYLNAFHAPLVFGALVVPLLRAPLLLLPVHLVWLEIIVHPTSALIFEADPAKPNTMQRPPVDPRQGLLRADDWQRPLAIGAVLSLAVIVLYVWGLRSLDSHAARALAMTTMIVGQTLIVLTERAAGPVWKLRFLENRRVVPIVLFTLLSLACALYVPQVARVLSLAPLSAHQVLLAVAVAAVATLWLEPFKKS
ncbi:MAG: cation-translocating P-type ATPase [Vulcanimicrobiaceae bacterium]